MPTETMEVSDENPYPRKAIQTLAQEWMWMHPGVRIEFTRVSTDQSAYISWVNTQAAGGTIPEIIFWWPGGDYLAQRGWAVSLDEFLARPNPYVRGNTAWRDLFLAGCLEPPHVARDGHCYHIPFDLFMSGVFYNKHIFAEAGITGLPKDWEAFMALQRRIREAGYEPFWGAAMWSMWPHALFGNLLYDEAVFDKLDVLYPNGRLEPEEEVRGAFLGITGTHELRFHEFLRLMKEWSVYWKRGFSLSKNPESLNLSRLGKLGMSWESAGGVSLYRNDPGVDFDIGFFNFCPITTKTSPAGSGKKPPLQAWPGTCFYLTRSAEEKGLVDLCVDWLMYLTSPENAERLTQEETALKVPSAVAGVRPDPSFADILDYDLKQEKRLLIPWGLSAESADNFTRIFELFLLGALDEDETLERMKKWEKIGIEQAIRNNQMLANEADRWDMSKW